MRSYDALIIGSGISGLISALLLTKKGQKVAIVEKHYKPGGYLHSFKRFGLDFETGAHYTGGLGEGQLLRSLLEVLEVYDQSCFEALDHNSFDQFFINDKVYCFHQGMEKTVVQLCEYFPKHEHEIIQYFDLVQSVAQLTEESILNKSQQTDTASILKWAGASLQEVVTSIITNSELQNILYAYCFLHGVEAKDTPFAFHASMTNSFISGAHGFKKSGDDFVQIILDQAKKQGVEIFLNEAVTSLIVNDDRIESVITDKNQYHASNIISSIHPKLTYALLSHDPTRTIAKKRLEKMQETTGMVALYAKLNGPLKLSSKKNYFLSSIENLGDPFTTFDPGDPKICFLGRPSRKQKKEYSMTAHIPCSFKFVKQWCNSPYGNRDATYATEKEKWAKAIMKFIDSYFPGTSQKIEKYNISSPLSNLHFNGSVEGSAYGIYHSIDNTGIRGILPKTKVQNLFLTGQNITFPGIKPSALSALKTVSYLVNIESFYKQIKERMIQR